MGFLSGLVKALPGIGTGLSIAEGVLGAAQGLSQMGKAGKINPNFVPYKTSEYAKKKMGMAQQLFNGRMAGASNEENNILANQANQISNINKNATDSTTALALAGGVQGQTNQALNNLGTKEAQNKYSLLNNLNDAYQTMIGEGDKENQSLMQKYGLDVESKAQLNQAGANNLFGGIDKVAGGLIMSPYTFGGRGGMMGGMTRAQSNQIRNGWQTNMMGIK